MKAVGLIPRAPNSLYMAELPAPSVAEAPNGRGVLVKVLRVGMDGTDKEIQAVHRRPDTISWYPDMKDSA